jgi:peptidoglycan/LPS O-acetylase OafA/YrhL
VEFDRTGDISLKQFYLRRVLRIFPPFYLVLGVTALLTYVGFMQGSVNARGLLAQAGHVTNYYIISEGWWDGISPGTWVYWSLAIEEHFYLFFPLVYLLLRKTGASRDKQALALFALCLVVLAWRYVLIFALEVSKDRVYLATDTRVDSILAGCILAIWRNPVLDRNAWNDRKLAFAWLPIGVAMVLVSLVLREPRFEQTLRYSLQSFGLLPVFVAAIRWHDRWPFRILNYAPVRYVGFLTYSLYLMHPSMIWALEKHTPWGLFVRGVLALGLLLAFASLIYRYVEKPCARVRRNLSRYMDKRKAASDDASSTNPVAA